MALVHHRLRLSGSDCIVVANSAFEDCRSTPQPLWSLFHWPSEDCAQAIPESMASKMSLLLQGYHCVLQANINGRQYMAVGWNGKKLKMFISMCRFLQRSN